MDLKKLVEEGWSQVMQFGTESCILKRDSDVMLYDKKTEKAYLLGEIKEDEQHLYRRG